MLTYETVKPLIAEENPSGDSILYVFRCPLSGVQVPSQHDFPKPKGAAAGAKKTIMRSLLTFAQTGIKTAGKALFGKSKMGKMATNIAKGSVKSVGKEAIKSRIFTAKEKRYGAVEAFRAVQGQFLWDGFRSTWLARSEASRFISDLQQQIASAGLIEVYDRRVAARVMVEVAEVERRISPAEEDFLIRFLQADHHTVGEIMTRPPLTDAELDLVSGGDTRTTVMMMAWVMALSDGEMGTTQQQALQRFGSRLGLEPGELKHASEMAQSYMVEEVMRNLYCGGDSYNDETRARAYRFAGRIGMAGEDAEKTEAAFLKRLSYDVSSPSQG